MLGANALRRLWKNPRETAAALADPLAIWAVLEDRRDAIREGQRPRCHYEVDPEWDRHLHEALGLAWPCPERQEFDALWREVVSELTMLGIRVGPESFYVWNDGDPEFVRAAWCLVRHLRPVRVVETGVAHGFTTRFILEALARNGGYGRLWSIDVPPIDPEMARHVGVAVGGRHPERWTYIKGPSRLRLPPLLAMLGTIDLFVHDSMHTERNVRFELDRAWRALRASGGMIVDDIDVNQGFKSFGEAAPAARSFICQSEPLRPDTRRFDGKGLFGAVLK
jgi:hypothetical protein